MIRYQITEARLDRLAVGAIDWLQIRQKDWPARRLIEFARQAAALVRPARVLINERSDVALAAGLDGVHLPSDAISPAILRKHAPRGFMIGVSCHYLDEVRRAEQEGADFVVFGPVFAPLSKSTTLPATGLERLREAASVVKIPVLALGGVTPATIGACTAHGAAGVAGITLFSSSAPSRG